MNDIPKCSFIAGKQTKFVTRARGSCFALLACLLFFSLCFLLGRYRKNKYEVSFPFPFPFLEAEGRAGIFVRTHVLSYLRNEISLFFFFLCCLVRTSKPPPQKRRKKNKERSKNYVTISILSSSSSSSSIFYQKK